MPGEPEQLRRGKEFHAQVQRDWEETAEGAIHVEHGIPLVSTESRRRRGRLDIFVDGLGDLVAVVEIKATDWDRIKPRNIQRNLGAHRRQIWRYIEKYIDVDGIDCSAGVIYPRAPRNAALRQRIEGYFSEHAVTVVWFEEAGSDRPG